MSQHKKTSGAANRKAKRMRDEQTVRLVSFIPKLKSFGFKSIDPPELECSDGQSEQSSVPRQSNVQHQLGRTELGKKMELFLGFEQQANTERYFGLSNKLNDSNQKIVVTQLVNYFSSIFKYKSTK